MDKGRILDILIALREDCFQNNLVVESEEPEFYAAIQRLILRVEQIQD
jgi:hypothetical protein